METNTVLERLLNPNAWEPQLFLEFDRLPENKLADCIQELQQRQLYKGFNKAYQAWTKTAIQEEPFESITAAELAALELPPLEWIVKGLLPPGLAMLAAPSKSFKSFMALQLCLAVCSGAPFLGFDCNKAACLYFDLESGKRRPKDRLQKVNKGKPMPDNLYIVTGEQQISPIGEAFEQQLDVFLAQHPDVRLVVIDVFQMIRKAAKRNENGYDRDYGDFQILRSVQAKYNVCILLIHHTRKMKDSDVFNQIHGSVGVMGALDTAMMIDRESRSDANATLHITGRDIEQQELAIRFDKESFCWISEGTTQEQEYRQRMEEYQNSPIISTIEALINNHGGTWTGTATEIIQASRAFSITITDDPARIGLFIREYEPELWAYDHITVEYPRKSSGREMRFVKN